MTDSTTGTTETEFDGTIENAFGVELATPIAYVGTYSHVLDLASVPADEKPNDEAILKLVNDKRKANARQKAMAEALKEAGIERPTLENSEALQISTIVKTLLATKKYTVEQATAQAKAMLQIA